MVAKSDISRIEFNEIEQAKKYATAVGGILESKLGKMLIESTPCTIDGTIQDSFEYIIEFSTKVMPDGDDILIYTLSYTTGTSETAEEVLTGLSSSLSEEASERVSISLELDSTGGDDNYLFILGEDSIVSTLTSGTGIVIDNDKEYTESGIPACYLGYGAQPSSSLPRLVITPNPQQTVCDLMESSIEEIDGEEVEFTSSYLNYSMTLTCEAGSTDDVLQSGVSAQSILNYLRKSMTNEIIKKTVQNSLDSVCYPIMNINPLPLMEYTEYQDIASCVAEFSCVDVFYPEVTSGVYDTIVIAGDVTDPDNVSGFSDGEGEDIIIVADVSTITID